MNIVKTLAICLVCLAAASCESVSLNVTPSREELPPAGPDLSLKGVARIVSRLPMGSEHIREVYDAVNSSSSNGYDEEYTMERLFNSPGAGVGSADTKAAGTYENPLRKLFTDYFLSEVSTKAGTAADVESYIDALRESDMQIYWPYSEQWDGQSYPLITFDPGLGAEANYAFEVRMDESGARVVDSVLVDEAVARTRPVWVINTTDDSAFTPMELYQETKAETAAEAQGSRILKLKSFTMKRNYDSWFAGASEFMIRCGSVQDFKAKTEAELSQYNPLITDMMVVVKRSQVGKEIEIGTLLMPGFTDQLENIAFMVTEDDGGVRTSWKCSATVKIASKSYGFDVELPFNSKDDIVWRGQIPAGFFKENGGVNTGRFGDVQITFEMD